MTFGTLNANDIIQIVDTRGIYFLSAPRGRATSPNGNWIVIGFVGTDVVACKDGAIIRVPSTDVRKIGGYSTDRFMSELKKATNGGRSIDMISRISSMSDRQPGEVRQILLDHGLPLAADSEVQALNIEAHVRRLLGMPPKEESNGREA